jgi:hypothetical protein
VGAHAVENKAVDPPSARAAEPAPQASAPASPDPKDTLPDPPLPTRPDPTDSPPLAATDPPGAVQPVPKTTQTITAPVPADTPTDPPQPGADPAKRAARRSFEAVMRQATATARDCLQREGLMDGDTVSFAVTIAAGTGKVVAAAPRGLHRERAALGACLLAATARDAVAPAPASDLVKPYEVAL